MKLKYLLLFLLSSYSTIMLSQIYSGKILDSVSKQPISYVAIQFKNTSNGVISNEDGNFSIFIEKANNNDVLNVSCLGFAPKEITINEFLYNGNIIYLNEYVNQLDTVFITNKTPSIDSIIAWTNQNIKTNYYPNNKRNKIFHRSTVYMDFDRLEFDIDKASGMRKSKLEGANKSLDSLSNAVMNSNIIHFTDFAGTYYILDQKNVKLKVDKATALLDKNKDFSMEKLEKKGKEIILKYLDPDKTYKVKTGLFKIEDSLSLKEEMKKEKRENDKKEFGIGEFRDKSLDQLEKGFLEEDNFIQKVIDPKLYKFELSDVTLFMNEIVYVVKFKPRKSSSKYSGKHYISSTDFGILRTDYQFAKGKRGEKFNLRLLIGVKYVENLTKGTVLYDKTDEGHYKLKYVYRDIGRYIYVHRPFKFIENSKRKNKTSFDFLLEGNIREKQELLLLETKPMNKSEYDAFIQQENVPYQELNHYDPKIWSAYNVIEPLEEMKQFKSSE